MSDVSPQDIGARRPDRLYADRALEQSRRAVTDAGYWSDNQQMGRRWAVACVALEITQRCNLDCTLCYLSETAEFIKDLPLAEIFRRIELIRRHYGKHTNVQITGGEPTLRDEAELLAIVAKLRDSGLRSTLMTNGIRARRPLLERLAEAGLADIAFHVDTTQGLAVYTTEIELNVLREKYLERTRGLPLSVMFNTTVHARNLHEIPELARFFVHHAGRVRTASFQLQANTGRGVLGQRDESISINSVIRKVEEGAATVLNFDACRIGSPECNRYALCLEVNGKLFDLFRDGEFFGRLQQATTALPWDRTRPWTSAFAFLFWLAKSPRYLPATLRWAWSVLRKVKDELIGARGRVHTLSFLVHNFMDAGAIDCRRIDTCAFKVMTAEGPLSMCLHNAKRDQHVLAPVKLTGDARRYWQPKSGEITSSPRVEFMQPQASNTKNLKGAQGLRASARRLRTSSRVPAD